MHAALNHYAEHRFWSFYRELPPSIRRLADREFAVLKQDPRHPSLQLKRIGDFWSVRVGLHWRALGRHQIGGIAWFWIGPHAEYDRLLVQLIRR